MFAFVVFGLVFSALSQKITWEERLQNDLFCVGWEVKTLNQSVTVSEIHFMKMLCHFGLAVFVAIASSCRLRREL